jgi:hypothetical protein
VLVLLAHVAVLTALGPSIPAKPTHARAAQGTAPRISWLWLVPQAVAERAAASSNATSPNPEPGRPATPQRAAAIAARDAAARDVPPAPAAPTAVAEVSPAQQQVSGVALPGQIAAFGAGAAFGLHPGAGRPPNGVWRTPPGPADPASMAAQAELVAALQRQVAALGDLPLADEGRCRIAGPGQLRCEHAAAETALGNAASAIAYMLHDLAVIDRRLREPTLSYGQGGFRLDLQ